MRLGIAVTLHSVAQSIGATTRA